MPALADTQAAFRAAIVTTGAAPILGRLRAPADAEERMAIYRRHYRESFRRHLRGRYPTLEWLVGTDRMVALADATLRRSPPRAPSLAEYGAALIDTVAADADLPPYLADVARLDWTLGRLAVAVDARSLSISALAEHPAQTLPELRLHLQPGLAYIASGWPVDTLVHFHLRDSAPDTLAFAPENVWLQLRGARGQFALQRLDPAVLSLRQHLTEGATLGEAIAAALTVTPDFDVSGALATLFAEGLVISISAGDTP